VDIVPVTLEGRLVRLEPLGAEHVDALMQAGAAEEIWTWLPCRPQTRDEFARWVDEALSAQAAGEQLPFATAERATGEVIGSTRFLNISRPNRRVEIGGTWLTPRVQKTAMNTEAKYLMLQHAFETLGCLRVELKTDARNENSQRAIARIGGVREGVFRKHQLAQHGFQRDSVYFSIIDDEWPAVRARLEEMLGR
jgi:RimJ/RimL family protein N-acetyltransferase